MGLRGPGAKAIRRPAGVISDDQRSFFAPVVVKAAAPAWEAPGLNRAERVVAFLESLEVTAGRLAGQAFRVRDWQRDIIEAIYREDDEGKRPVRTAVLTFGRKNGKTGLAAGLALCHLAGPEAERRGEVYSAANDKEQAGKTFAEMVAMVEVHPILAHRINVKRFGKELEDMETSSIFKALSADVAGKHGLSPSCVIYDELGQAANRELYDTLDTAMGARDNPLLMVISTQAATDIAPMSQLVDYGRRVNDGVIDDPSFFLAEYSAPIDADPWVEETWKLANPALGDFLSLGEVKRQAEQARRMPAKEPAFRNLILNQRVASERTFLGIGEWKACNSAVDLERLKGRKCFAGLDLSAVRDLTALVLVFPDDDGAFDVVPFFWLPNDGLLDREEDDRVPYMAWRQSGFLLTTPGISIQPDFIAAHVARMGEIYDLRMVGFDRWRIEEFQRALADTGADIPMHPVGQGYKDMAPAVDLLERLVAERRLRHGGHPVLTWCATNTVATPDPAGNRKLDKMRSRGRIDGMVALAMALITAAKFGGEEEWVPMMEVV
ncbi:MAG: terminase large subunit [Proteobacteria bacterium]|nr:terminase large subunit [Pseudomonadota bacterium]